MLSADLERFYELLCRLEAQPEQGRTLSEYTGRSLWPRRGVYFFQEPGEYRSGMPEVPRIVRVGTHAISGGSKSSLWGRLRAHRGSLNGGGNHRGSIFRLHVGTALLKRDREVIGELPTWAEGSSAPKLIRSNEAAHERRVSDHIGVMSVLWVDVPDEPGPESRRGYLERNAIALLSNGLEPLDRPSLGWLGLHSPRAAIRRSGLWNLNHVDERYDPAFLDVLAEFVARTIHS
jgi:hypothetical protein